MTTTVFLKFQNKEEWDALSSWEFLSFADVLGDISSKEYADDNGNIIPARTVEGWHVNWPLCRDVPLELQPFIIPEPANPKCVFL